jgi:hypothetical protein
MTEIVFQIVIIAAACVWFAEHSPIVHWIKLFIAAGKAPEIEGPPDIQKAHLHTYARKMRLKPFDCPLCLSFWVSLPWFSITLNDPAAWIYAACTSLLAVWISKQVAP